MKKIAVALLLACVCAFVGCEEDVSKKEGFNEASKADPTKISMPAMPGGGPGGTPGASTEPMGPGAAPAAKPADAGS